MLLAQRSQPINLNLNFSRHRRHPASLSNISVHPHPSSTPGLLTLSKPIRQPVRNHQRPQSPRYNPRARVLEHQQQSRPALHSVSATESISNTKTDAKLEQQVATATPQHQRSRSTRHKSTSAAVLETSSAPVPALAIQRPSEPIPVPDPKQTPHRGHKIISHSDPAKLTIHTNYNVKRKDKRRRNKPKSNADGPLPLAEWDYPAPGSSDEGEDEERDHDPEPVTPIRHKINERAWYSDGPKTAPLQGRGQFFFPSNPSATRPEHRRAPSQPASLSRETDGNYPRGIVDGIFHLSLSDDEEIPDVQKKIALLFGAATPTPPSRKTRASTPSPRKRALSPTPSPRKNRAQRERYVRLWSALCEGG